MFNNKEIALVNDSFLYVYGISEIFRDSPHPEFFKNGAPYQLIYSCDGIRPWTYNGSFLPEDVALTLLKWDGSFNHTDIILPVEITLEGGRKLLVSHECLDFEEDKKRGKFVNGQKFQRMFHCNYRPWLDEPVGMIPENVLLTLINSTIDFRLVDSV